MKMNLRFIICVTSIRENSGGKVSMTVKVAKNDYSDIRGFNYQPSYASRGFEVWEYFSPESWRTEIGRGKQFFPKMDAIRF